MKPETLRGAVSLTARALAPVSDAALLEAYELVRAVSGADRTRVVSHPDEPLDARSLASLADMTARRLGGEPLQYILGEWDFMGMTFAVGEGVLCPRAETETLARTVLDALKGRGETKVLDLCAGSGCIGVSVAALAGNADVTLFERSRGALEYLRRNLSLCRGAKVVEGDVFSGFEAYNIDAPDILVSNPPYVPSKDIDSLQAEVRREPREALDGGGDGLDFYRAIAALWQPFIRAGGLLAVECGEGQASEIAEIFSGRASQVTLKRDDYGVERFVIAENNRKEFCHAFDSHQIRI